MTEEAKMRYLAVRCFRHEFDRKSGRRGRRLVIDLEQGGVTMLGHHPLLGGAQGMEVDPSLKNDMVRSLNDLIHALQDSRTPLVVVDEALTKYVNEHDGQLPLEGLPPSHRTDVAHPDDFVDMRPEAVRRRERIAKWRAEQAKLAEE
jgi:hypothetical protein